MDYLKSFLNKILLFTLVLTSVFSINVLAAESESVLTYSNGTKYTLYGLLLEPVNSDALALYDVIRNVDKEIVRDGDFRAIFSFSYEYPDVSTLLAVSTNVQISMNNGSSFTRFSDKDGFYSSSQSSYSTISSLTSAIKSDSFIIIEAFDKSKPIRIQHFNIFAKPTTLLPNVEQKISDLDNGWYPTIKEEPVVEEPKEEPNNPSGNNLIDIILNSFLEFFKILLEKGLLIITSAIGVGVVFQGAKWLWRVLRSWLNKI